MNSTVWRGEQNTLEQTDQIQALREEVVSRDARNAAQAKQMAEHMASLRDRLNRERATATLDPVGIRQIPVMATVGDATKVFTPPPAEMG
eukprot:13285828-Heterocapsa_arctica.AAC.1